MASIRSSLVVAYICVATVVGSALIGLVAATLAYQQNERRSDYGATTEKAGEAEPSARRVPTPAPNPEPERDEWRQERDLEAQREMAKWAWLMVVVSGFGVVVSVAAVLLIRDTLKETRRTNEGFVRASKQELTAYITGDERVLVQKFGETGGYRDYVLTARLRFRNSGQTPAFDVTCITVSAWGTAEEAATWQMDSEAGSRGVIGPSTTFTMEKLVGASASYPTGTLENLVEAKNTIWIRGRCQYRDINGCIWEHTFFMLLRDPSLILRPRLVEADVTREFTLHYHSTGNDLRMIRDQDGKEC